jgi:hypothetical protein
VIPWRLREQRTGAHNDEPKSLVTAGIPDPPRLRYEKCVHGSRHMLGSDLTPFVDSGLAMNYFVDGVTGSTLSSVMAPCSSLSH